MLVLLSLILACLGSTNYSALNASIPWIGLVVWNHAAFPISTPPTLPYQIIEDVAPNTINGHFNFSNDPTIMCAQNVETTNPERFRADSS